MARRGGFYRTGLDMFRKYTVKFNPTVIGSRFTDVKDIALERAEQGLITIDAIRQLVKPILEAHGITGGVKGTYYAFALALARRIMRNKGESAKKIAAGLKAYYVQAYDLDPAVCDEIINVVAGWVSPY